MTQILKVTDSRPLETVVYEAQPDGHADVWLRQNQTETEDGYEADEIYLKVTASFVRKEEIEADAAWWFGKLKDETEEIYADALSIQTVRSDKKAEVSGACREAIHAGVDVTLESGETGHFSLEEADQINLHGKLMQLLCGAEELEYHQDGCPCRYYSAVDMQEIISRATAHVSYHTAYCNSLFTWISGLSRASEIEPVRYGDVIPEAYQSEVLRGYLA